MYFKHPKATIFYQKEGDSNETILILPGWGNTRPTFQRIINHFKDSFTIYIVDYPGFGNSPSPNQELTMDDYKEIIDNFIKKQKIHNPIIIAHSFGGRIVSLLKTNISKCILIDVAGIKRKKIKVWIKEKIYKITKKILILFHKKELVIKLKNVFASEDYKDVPKNMQKTFQNIIKQDLKKEYQKLSCETLIIWGEKDQDTPLKDAYLLNRLIPNSGLTIYKNSTHFSYLEKWVETNIILEEFLKKKDKNH